MTSFNQMIQEKTLKRADAMKAKLSDIHEDSGFNWRHEGEDLNASIEEIANFLIGGGQPPEVEVYPREDGGVVLVDGHRRTRGYHRALELGATLDHLRDKDGVIWIGIKPFLGDELQRNARVLTSNEGRKLTQLELAEGYQRMRDLGASNEQIAKLVNKSIAHVQQMAILDAAPAQVKEAIKTGTIAATEAVKLLRDHKEDAAEELALRQAKTVDGKVTAKVAPKKPKQDASTLIQAVRGFVATIDEGIKERILMGTLEYVEVDCAFLAEIIEAASNLPEVE